MRDLEPDDRPVLELEVSETADAPFASRKSKAFILEGSVLKAVLRLAWPMWVAMGLQDAYSLVDLFWVGKLGKEAIAALALCGILMGFVFTVAIGISTGVVALVARYMGMGDDRQASRVTWQALYMGLSAGVAATIVGIPVARPGLWLLGAQGMTLGLGTVYLQIMACGAGLVFVTFSMNSALRGAGDTVTPMIAMLIGTVVNIVLDPFLIFGWSVFPALGVAGSALATVIAQSLGMVFVLATLLSGRGPVRLALDLARPSLSLMWRVLRVGAFGSLQMWFRNLSALVVISVITPYGDAVTASFGVGMRLMMVVLLPGFGVGNAAATVVGQNLGAKQIGRAKHAGWVATWFYLAIVVAFGSAFAIFAPSIVRLFNDHAKVVEAGTLYLRIIAASFPLLALAVVLSRGMTGAGDTLTPMWIAGLCLLGIQIPGAILLSRWMGYPGIWLAISSANGLNGILIAIWYVRGKWALKKV